MGLKTESYIERKQRTHKIMRKLGKLISVDCASENKAKNINTLLNEIKHFFT